MALETNGPSIREWFIDDTIFFVHPRPRLIEKESGNFFLKKYFLIYLPLMSIKKNNLAYVLYLHSIEPMLQELFSSFSSPTIH